MSKTYGFDRKMLRCPALPSLAGTVLLLQELPPRRCGRRHGGRLGRQQLGGLAESEATGHGSDPFTAVEVWILEKLDGSICLHPRLGYTAGYTRYPDCLWWVDLTKGPDVQMHFCPEGFAFIFGLKIWNEGLEVIVFVAGRPFKL